MRSAALTLVILTSVAAFTADDADNYKRIVAENATIRPTYEKIRDQSSQHFQSFKDKIEAGQKDAGAIQEYYDEVAAELAQLKAFRRHVDLWNKCVESGNALIETKQNKAAEAAARKAQMADVNAFKSYSTTEFETKGRSGWVANSDGTLAFVSGTETGLSTKITRENPATAARRARLEKEEIAAKSQDEQADLERQKLTAVECDVRMDQLDALLANENKKRKYLLGLEGKQQRETPATAEAAPKAPAQAPAAKVDPEEYKRQWEEKWKTAPVYKLSDGTEIRAQRDNDLGQKYLIQDFEGKWHSVEKADVKEVVKP